KASPIFRTLTDVYRVSGRHFIYHPGLILYPPGKVAVIPARNIVYIRQGAEYGASGVGKHVGLLGVVGRPKDTTVRAFSSLDYYDRSCYCQAMNTPSTQKTAPRGDQPHPSKGEASRTTILLAAAKLATMRGLDGLSIGDLAAEVGMSK